MEEKEFEVIQVASGENKNVPISTAVQIENIGTGVVSVSNGVGGAKRTFFIQAGQTQMLSGAWLNAQLNVSCDALSTSQVVYWR